MEKSKGKRSTNGSVWVCSIPICFLRWLSKTKSREKTTREGRPSTRGNMLILSTTTQRESTSRASFRLFTTKLSQECAKMCSTWRPRAPQRFLPWLTVLRKLLECCSTLIIWFLTFSKLCCTTMSLFLWRKWRCWCMEPSEEFILRSGFRAKGERGSWEWCIGLSTCVTRAECETLTDCVHRLTYILKWRFKDR